MKKLGLLFKEISQSLVKKNLREANGIFVINYSKLSSPDLTNLRRFLMNAHAALFVVKNSVVRRALKDAGWDSLVSVVEGPCGLVFSKDEPVDASRILYNFSREHESLKVRGGFLKDRILGQKDIEVLARLPSKEVLRVQVVMGLKSPISGLVYILKGNLRKLVLCLGQIKNKKSS